MVKVFQNPLSEETGNNKTNISVWSTVNLKEIKVFEKLKLFFNWFQSNKGFW